MTRLAAVAAALGFAHTAWATTYVVNNARNAGVGSLRWAIKQANTHTGPDEIHFAPALSGQTILLTKALPALNDAGTTIDGDIDDDASPDIVLNGRRLAAGSGLLVQAHECAISGLAIVRFPHYGVLLDSVSKCQVRTCHLGVNLAGTKPSSNGRGELILWWADDNLIGGPTAAERNIVAGGYSGLSSYTTGILVANGHYNKVQGNYVGLKRDGSAVLGEGGCGIALAVVQFIVLGAGSDLRPPPDGPAVVTCVGNQVGGTTAGRRNVIAGVDIGVEISNASQNTVSGNYIGLNKGGYQSLPIATAGIDVTDGSTDNTIGGLTDGARNVFAGGKMGVTFRDTGTANNKVQGNYFGLNARGTRQRSLEAGVWVYPDAGAQTIGGNRANAGNYFAALSANPACGVILNTAGGGTLIRHNGFGVQPDGTAVVYRMDLGIAVGNVAATILDNRIENMITGIDIGGPAGYARILRNDFKFCVDAVRVTNIARCFLGDLGNSNSNDDGGNFFQTSNTWHIRNYTASRIKAEGNDFGSFWAADINAKIWDRRDDKSLGRVDFNPLMGGVIPTGEILPLTITSATARPTTVGGAEIAFALSAPADVTVTVLNIAGRAVATVMRDRSTKAGLQRITWAGHSDRGTLAPNGTYLARIVAQDAHGQQAQAICSLRLGR
jgi:hypothetical protein